MEDIEVDIPEVPQQPPNPVLRAGLLAALLIVVGLVGWLARLQLPRSDSSLLWFLWAELVFQVMLFTGGVFGALAIWARLATGRRAGLGAARGLIWTGLVLVAFYIAFIGTIQAIVHQLTFDAVSYSPPPYLVTIIHTIGQPLALAILGLGAALLAFGSWTRWTSAAHVLTGGSDDATPGDEAGEVPEQDPLDPEQSFRPEGARHG
ncbi:hypothetical protein GCM10028820_06990 [Tessaracoccus terricola]